MSTSFTHIDITIVDKYKWYFCQEQDLCIFRVA